MNTVAFTPDGHTLISGSDDRLIKLWNWELGTQLLSFNSGHWGNVFQARALPESGGNVIVSSAADGQIRVAQLREGSSTSVVSGQIGHHGGRAHRIALLDTPWTLLSCGEDGVVLHFDLRQRSPSSCLTEVGRRANQMLEVYSVDCNPLAPWQFCVGAQDHTVRVFDLRKSAVAGAGEKKWNGASGIPVCSLIPRRLVVSRQYLDVHVTCAVYSKRGEILASYNNDTIYLFSADASNGTECDPRELSGTQTPLKPDADDEAGPSSGKRQQKHGRHEPDAWDGNKQSRGQGRTLNHLELNNHCEEDGTVVMRRFSPSPAHHIPKLATFANGAQRTGDVAAAGAAEGSVVWRLQRGGWGIASAGASGDEAVENEGESAADEEQLVVSFSMSESEGREDIEGTEEVSSEEDVSRCTRVALETVDWPSVDDWMARHCELASSVLQRPGGVLQMYRGTRIKNLLFLPCQRRVGEET